MTAVTVHLDEADVAFADSQVKAGNASSVEDVVRTAVGRVRRHHMAVRDAEIMEQTGIDDDLDVITEWQSRQPFVDDY